ncbi:MAG: hypothetical protein WAM66_05420 [Acidobacteriaceae bacterium]
MASSLAVLAVLSVRGRFSDPDMWWHLKSGEIIWKTHAIPTVDLFSFTAFHHALVPQEWLSQLLIYGAYRLDGYSGLMLWLCCFTTALLLAGYALCSLYSGNAKIGLLGAIVLWFFSTVGLSIRPQLIGYFLLVLELLVLHLGKTRDPRWLLCLPPLFLLWVNCHGSFFLGLLVLGVVLACSFFNFQAGALVCSRWEFRRRKMFVLALALSGAATFLNPAGWKQVLYPVDTMLRQPVNVNNVQEWLPLPVSDPRGAALLAILLLVFVVLIVRRSEVLYLHELALLALGTWLALSHQRLAFVFGILAAPIVARLLSDFWEGYDPGKDRPLPNLLFIAVMALAVFLGFPSRQVIAKQIDKENPVKAVEYIKANHLSGNMLNAYGYGGYLIWTLPEHPVFIDGRADLYEWAGVLTEYGQWAMLESDPNLLLDKYHIGFCLLERTSPMAYVLPLMHNWKEVYSDKSSVIFVRTGGASTN